MPEFSDTHFASPGNCSWKLDKEIHIWKFPAIEMDAPFLTPAEKEFAGRFHFNEDRNRFVTGRHALRLLLSKYLSVLPEEIVLAAGPGQKPRISSPSSHIFFNVSHSGHWVLIAFSSNEVGIDIEKINSDFEFEDLMDEHFSLDEQSFVLMAADPPAAFYNLWTRKEALTKGWGTGLQENLKQVNVLEGSLEEIKKISWALESFSLSAIYPAAIAYTGLSGNIRYFEGTDFKG